MSIFTAPSAFQAPFCWRTVKFGACVPDQSTECRIDRVVVPVEHLHVHAREVAWVFAHMRGDFGFRDRGGDGPGRVEIDAGDFGGQRRRRLFGLADDHAIAPHHRVVLDRFGEGRRKVDDDIALAKLEIHVFQPFERGLKLPDPLLNRDVEGGERARRHGAGGGKAMAHLETLDGFGHRLVERPGCLVGGEVLADDQARRNRSSWGPATPTANLASAGISRPAAADREVRIAQRGLLDPLRGAFVEGRLMR